MRDALERINVLGYPKIARRVSASEARELLEMLRLQAELIEDPDGPPAVRSPDPDDDYLICLDTPTTFEAPLAPTEPGPAASDS